MGAVLNYRFHFKVIWAYTMVNLMTIIIANYWSAEVLRKILCSDHILNAAYFLEAIVYFIIMSQFVMLQAVTKIRFTALNKMFW